MNIKLLFLVCFICIQTVSAQKTTSYLNIKLHEYKTFIISPGLSTVDNEVTDGEVDQIIEGFVQNVISGLSAADKAALGFGAIGDEKRLKNFILKNLDIKEYDTEATAVKERDDYIKTYRGYGYAIYTIAPATQQPALKHIQYTRPLKGFNYYPANTIASMKESGKKHFFPVVSALNLRVDYATWRKYKIKDYMAKGLHEITDSISFAEKNHVYFGKTDKITGIRMIYALGYLTSDYVYEESFYVGMRPEVQTSGTPAEQMAQLKGAFNNIRALIVKEVGNYTTSFFSAAMPYTEADLNDGVKFMKALQEGKLSCSTSWYSVGKQFKEKPVIYLEIHPSKMIKVTVTQNEVVK